MQQMKHTAVNFWNLYLFRCIAFRQGIFWYILELWPNYWALPIKMALPALNRVTFSCSEMFISSLPEWKKNEHHYSKLNWKKCWPWEISELLHTLPHWTWLNSHIKNKPQPPVRYPTLFCARQHHLQRLNPTTEQFPYLLPDGQEQLSTIASAPLLIAGHSENHSTRKILEINYPTPIRLPS